MWQSLKTITNVLFWVLVLLVLCGMLFFVMYTMSGGNVTILPNFIQYWIVGSFVGVIPICIILIFVSLYEMRS